MKSAIYMIFNVVNEKFYIGSAVNLDKRLASHLWHLTNNSHYNRYLQRAWDKYGFDNFQFYRLELCDKEKLIEREQHYIDLLKPKYNLSPTAGSCLGVKHTEETKLKMSEWQVGRKMSDEAKQKMSKAAKGNSNAAGYKHPPEVLLRLTNLKRGRKHTEEHKAKISAALKGNKSHTGRTFSEEHRKKLSNTRRKKYDHVNINQVITEW